MVFDCRTVLRAAAAAGGIAVVALAAPLAAAIPVAAQAATPMRKAAARPVEGVAPSVLFQIILAEVALQRGQLGTAWNTYMSLARETRDVRFARRAVEIAYADRKLERALEAARVWSELAPGEREAENTLVSLLVEAGQLSAAEPIIARRIAQADNKPGVVAEVQRLLARAPDRSAAFALLDRLAGPHHDHAEVRLALARGAMLAGNGERAVSEARAALKLEPGSEIAALTAAQLLVRQAPADAARVLEEFITANPASVEARLALGRAHAARGDYRAAHAVLREALDRDPSHLGVMLALGLVSAQADDYAVATQELRAYLDAAAGHEAAARDVDVALFSLAEIAEEQRRFDEANAYLDRIEPGPQYLAAQMRIARNLARSGRLGEARTLLHAVPAREEGEQQQLAAAEAQVLREARKYQEAFDLLADALKRWPEAAELLYDYALAAEKIDRTELMEATLLRVIALKPADPHAYNALGYWLADRTPRLDEAERLIGKAFELAPDDAFIIDSMGWLAYRRGQHARAVEWLERAYRLRADPEIAAHLGEAYWAAGKPELARAIWQRAHARDPANETLVDTLARHAVKF